MARFRERFEVKNEMQDGGKIRPDDSYKQNGGKSSKTQQQEILADGNEIGFDNEYEDIDAIDGYEDIDQGTYEGEEEVYEDNRNGTQDEYDTLNLQVESELAQYYDDDITNEELKAYLVSKISEIYGDRLEQCNLLADSMVEGFLDINEFDGVESYRQLIQSIEESIMRISKIQDGKNKGKTTEELSKETGLESLSEEEKQKIVSAYKNVSRQGDLSANAYISSQAKKLGIDKKELTTFVHQKGKEEINSPDKVLHYHRTSMQSFEQIMQTGYLLNRKNMQLNGIDISGLRGSSSANIQFSRDVYNDEGKLQSSGFDIEDNLGANSADVVFVMSPELMNEDTYNCLSVYPTVEKADIQRCCATILAKDPNIQMRIESILKGKNLRIRTMLQEEFDREVILEELNKSETSKEVKETGAVLKSVNGRDILSSAIQATEESTRTSIINQQVQTIRSVQKERTQQQSIGNNGFDR